jgi:hypothetical protein
MSVVEHRLTRQRSQSISEVEIIEVDQLRQLELARTPVPSALTISRRLGARHQAQNTAPRRWSSQKVC